VRAPGAGGDVLDTLLAGLVAGLVAGVLAALVAWWAVEPALEDAIRLEEGAAEASPGHGHEDAPVSRGVQRTVGLATGAVAVALAAGLGCAVAGLVAVRLGAATSPLGAACLAALGGGYAAGLLPALAYPANPPGIGTAESAGDRTLVYLGVVGAGVAAVAVAAVAGRVLATRPRLRLLAVGGVLVGVAAAAMAVVEPVAAPAGYPANLLWEFRRGSLLMQVGLWLALAAGFWLMGRGGAGRTG
jgi:hypothetical protein